MIIYKSVFEKLERAGYSINRIRREELIPEKTLQKIRKGELVNMNTINIICELTGKQISDIIAYVPDRVDDM